MFYKNPFDIDLLNKVVIITGAGGIMCSHFAKVVAQTGAKVVLLDINIEQALQYADEITKEGYYAKAYYVNVLGKKCLEEVRKTINTEIGTCDILINGAGGNNPKGNTEDEQYGADTAKDIKTFYDLDLDGFKFVFDLNFIGTLLPIQIFSADMLGKKECSIVNISSMNAIKPLTKLPAYSAAKSAISNLTEWLAVYFAKEGIRVNALAPGFFITNQNKPNLLNRNGTYTRRAEKILSQTPMNRFGNMEELSGILLFLLCHEASSFVTGTIIPIDGGFNAFSGV